MFLVNLSVCHVYMVSLGKIWCSMRESIKLSVLRYLHTMHASVEANYQSRNEEGKDCGEKTCKNDRPLREAVRKS